MNRSAVPPPVTLVLEAAAAWLPARMEAVEERLGRLVEGHGDALAADAGGNCGEAETCVDGVWIRGRDPSGAGCGRRWLRDRRRARCQRDE